MSISRSSLFSSLKISAAQSLLLLAFFALLGLTGCGGGGGNSVSQSIGISVTAPSTTVDGHDTATLTATVVYDSSNSGVTWTAPSIGSLSSLTSLTPTYTAPTANGSAQTVTLTATSVADKTKSASVTLTIPVAPTITTASLPSFTAGAAYSTTLAGAGGIAPYTWKVISGTLPTGVSLNATTGVLSAAAGATTTTPAMNLTFQMTDSGLPTALTATATLSLTINPPPSAPVAGSVIYRNSCGPLAGPATSVSINTTPVQSTTTDSNGNFAFANIPYGTYTVTPSLAGTNAVFSPATQNVTVGAGGAVVSFNAAVGYSVSGNVSYTGIATGPVNLALQYNCPNGGEGIVLGTSITAPGQFTINGAAPGSYTLLAWRDIVGHGVPNALDPTGSSTALAVSADNLTNVSVALTDPAPITLGPIIDSIGRTPFDQGVVLQLSQITVPPSSVSTFWKAIGVSYLEEVSSYNIQWSTDPTFSTNTHSKSFPATGTNEDSWVLNGLTNGQHLYFRYQGVAGSTTGPWSGLGVTTIGAPTGPVTVSGIATFANAATGPLYISFSNLSTYNGYYTAIANPVSPQPYSIQLPADGNYQIQGFIDQNNDGVDDNGDMYVSASIYNLAITGSTATKDVIATGGGNRFFSWQANNDQFVNTISGTHQYYNLSFIAWNGSKQLTTAELVSGPNVVIPQDFYRCTVPSLFSFYTSFSFLPGATPKVGDTYGLKLTYSDGSQETIPMTITTVPGSFGANPTPSGVGTNQTPNFAWIDPANASSYDYTFDLNGGVNWAIPIAGWGTFSSSIDTIAWNIDPTGGTDLPSASSLASGTAYNWGVNARDSSGNTSSLSVGYYPGYTHVYLPVANPATLEAATVGQSYTGAITATNGTAPYTFTVTGLCDGLTYSSNGGTLTISGTPLAAGTISFQVTVQDNTGTSWGPVTYTITVGN